MSLSADRIDSYRRDGIVFPLHVLAPEDALALGREYARFEDLCRERLGEVHRFKTHLLARWIYDLVADPRVLDSVEPFLGPDILVWGADLFYKPPRSPRFVAFHQDSTYWGLEPADLVLTAWLALRPSTVENGCLRVVPGSHRHGQLPHANDFAPHNVLVHGQRVVDTDPDQAIDVELAPGQMSIHHLRLVHGSGPNATPEPRLGLAIRYISTEVRQTGLRDSAALVRGEDRHGHFDLEPGPPAADFDDAAIAAFREAFQTPSGAGYSGGLRALEDFRARMGQPTSLSSFDDA